jgi:hypothetical protein
VAEKVDLNESGRTVTLARGVRLRTAGFRGSATLLPEPAGEQRAAEVERSSPALAEALANADMHPFRTVAMEAVPTGRPGAAPVRSADGRHGIVVEVPAVGNGQQQVLLLTDERGVRSWHYPQPAAPGSAGFLLPGEITTGGEPMPGENRGVIAAAGRKILSILVFPVVERAVGATAQFVAERLETRARPYLLRHFRPEEHLQRGVGRVEATDWDRLRGGRILLFLHGTFSSSNGGFGGLPAARLGELAAGYDGVLAFDHPTLSATPLDNVATLLDRIPADLRAEVDVIAHSRGGLVARALADETAQRDGPLRVRRIVFVATPNTGTLLTDPENTGTFFDRYTTLLDLVPDGPWSVVTDALSGVLTAVQITAQGLAGGLPGLAAMHPNAEWLKQLGDRGGPGVEHFAIDADFEPTGGLLRLSRFADAVADRVFGGAPNDFVVPTAGVSAAEGRVGFPVPADRRLHFGTAEQAWHCSLFSRPQTGAALARWCR